MDFRHAGDRVRLRSPENTRRGADAYELTLRGRLARGEPLLPDRPERPAVTLLGDFVPDWLTTYVDANNKPSEAASKRGILRVHILPIFGRYQLAEVNSESLERYKASRLALGLSAKTVNNHLTVLRKLLVTAKQWGRLASVPDVQWLRAMQPQPRYLTADEAARLIAAAKSPWREMIVLALNTGLRLGELLALHWDDLAPDGASVTVRRASARKVIGTPKSNRCRTIPLTQHARAALEHIRARRALKGLVFTTDGELIGHARAYHHLQMAAQRAGLSHVFWHALRHTYATQLVTLGANLRAVQALLGHSTVLMTERYTHVNAESLESAVKLLDRGVVTPKSGQLVGNGALSGAISPVADGADGANPTQNPPLSKADLMVTLPGIEPRLREAKNRSNLSEIPRSTATTASSHSSSLVH